MKSIMKNLVAIAGAFSIVLSAFGQVKVLNQIEGINFSKQGADVTVKVDLKEALSALPAGFSVANPAKIALDFPGVENATGKNSQVVNQGDLRSVNVVQAGERTRLILNLDRGMNYQTRLEGKSLYVTLSSLEKAKEPSSADSAMRFTEERTLGEKHALRDVTFRRGKDGEGRIVVDLSDSGTGIDIRQQGKTLVVDFLKTSLPDHLRRKMDVLDFATPVSQIETVSKGENARITITPNGMWEHNAYQSDSQFVIEVKRVIEDPNKLAQSSKIGYQGPKVSINYQNGDVRALLRLMAEELGLNAVISETVTGVTTLVLKDVPADQVIDIIFQQKGLDMRKKGNIIMIAPRDEIATREKLDFESKQQISELEPLVLEQFQLSYHKAIDVGRLLAGLAPTGGGGGGAGGTAQRILSKRGSAIADSNSNIVFVNDTPSKIEEIRRFIKAIDVTARQVLIEARVVEASDSFNRSLGAKLNFINSQSVSVARGVNLVGGSYAPATGTATMANGVVTSSVTAASLTQSSIAGVNLPSYTSTGGTMAFSLFNNALTRILNVEIAALESDGLGKVVSSPRVITANNVKAKIEDGQEIPYVVTTTTATGTTQTVSFKTAKLSLEVTPQITPEGAVKMNLTVKKEEPDWTNQVQGNPPIKSSIVETNVVVDNGGTVVIGGVFVSSTQNSVEKVPLLGDIPALGWLFKYKKDVGSRRELLVFITPRVVSEKMRFE